MQYHIIYIVTGVKGLVLKIDELLFSNIPFEQLRKYKRIQEIGDIQIILGLLSKIQNLSQQNFISDTKMFENLKRTPPIVHF